MRACEYDCVFMSSSWASTAIHGRFLLPLEQKIGNKMKQRFLLRREVVELVKELSVNNQFRLENCIMSYVRPASDPFTEHRIFQFLYF